MLELKPPSIVPLQFSGRQSLGIFCEADSRFVVVMVNGGAQTRCGSHRMQQQLATAWQQAGIASFRFDFPGFGDADGDPGCFVDHATILAQLPAQLNAHIGTQRPFVFLGLCDGATAALLASEDLNPVGVILLNPWLRTAQNHSKVMLKFYYLNRLVSAEFWRKVMRGQWNIGQTFRSLIDIVRQTPSPEVVAEQHSNHLNDQNRRDDSLATNTDLTVHQALQNWQRLEVPVQLILSGADLTAAECRQLLQQKQYRKLLKTIDVIEIGQANHTITDPVHFALLVESTTNWLTKLTKTTIGG